MQLEQGTSDDPHEILSIALEMSGDEARWLITALSVALRLLEGLHFDAAEGQQYQLSGLAALHRLAARVPPHIKGYYR